MSEQNAVVAIYASHVEAEEALEELQSGGIDMKLFPSSERILTPMSTRSGTTTLVTV